MNGAVQGDATTTASTPEPNASSVRFWLVHPRSDDGTTWPNSNTPARFNPSTKTNVASAATTSGVCSWKPQPSCAPALRNASSIAASSTNVAMTPVANAYAATRIVARSSWRCAKPSTLSDSTGNTQGIRLRMMPPTNANNAATASVIVPSAAGSGSAGVSSGFGPALPEPAAEGTM